MGTIHQMSRAHRKPASWNPDNEVMVQRQQNLLPLLQRRMQNKLSEQRIVKRRTIVPANQAAHIKKNLITAIRHQPQNEEAPEINQSRENQQIKTLSK